MDPRQYYNTIPLRLMVAVGMLFHGLPKFTPDGHQQFLGMLTGMGAPVPEVMSWVVPVIEVGGGIAVLFGLLTRLAAFGLLVVQAVALFAVHLPNGFNTINITGMTPQGPTFGMPGFEFNLLYISMLLALLIGGPGAIAAAKGRVPERRPGEEVRERPRIAA
ncbi:MAG: DoxX family protein [Gemmatimonadales bacterium]